MSTLLAIIVGVPLAVELLGACLSIFDNWGQPDARAPAVERLALPLLGWCLLWWTAGADTGLTLCAVLICVAAWQLIVFAIVRALSRWQGFQTLAEDTDAGHDSGAKKGPGDSGDWGGER